MKILTKLLLIIFIVILLISCNNTLNKVKGKVYLNEKLGTGVYFEGKKVSLIVQGEDGGEFELAMKWENILFYHKEESNFYQIFILEGDTLYFISMHTSEIERIGGVSGLQIDEYNKEYYIPLKLVKDINSYYNSLGERINNEKANNESINNKGIERYAGRWIDEDYMTWFIINTDGSVILKSYDETKYRVKDITKNSDTSYSFMTKEDYIFNLFFEDNYKCLMTTVVDGNKFSIWLTKE